MNKEEIQFKYLKVLFFGQLLIESMDDLETTPMFKQRLKLKVKSASLEVENEIKDQLKNVFEVDNEISINIFNQIDSLISRLSKFSLDELPLANKMLDELIADPKFWKEKLLLEFNTVT